MRSASSRKSPRCTALQAEVRSTASGRFTQSTVEDAALAWLEAVGWQVVHCADISPAGDTLTLALSPRERDSYGEVILARRLREALARLNPELPAEALEDAFRKLTRPDLPAGQAGGADLIQRNRLLHRLRLDGVTGFQIGLSRSVC